MNWQTREIDNWLNETGILNSQREEVNKLQRLVESKLLVRDYSSTDRLKNLVITKLLEAVEWEDLILNPNAWDDYEYEEEVTDDDENCWVEYPQN